MSIEKLPRITDVSYESIPFTQIANEVIFKIKDNDAFRIWSFSIAKSPDWEVIKEFTEKQCGVGERKGKQVWSYLQRCGLCMTVIHRNEQGQIIKHELRILNGSNFNENEPFIKQKTSGAETAPIANHHRCKNPPGGETTRVEMSPLLNKENKNIENKSNKDKSFYKKQNEKKPEWAEKSKNELKQNAKFWEPGNPDYDRVNGVKKNV